MSHLQVNLTQTSGFFYKIWLITTKRTFHLFEILFWPVIGLVSVGLLTKWLALQPDMVAFVLIGVIALSVVQIGQLDVSYVMLYSVWNKSLKQELAAPAGVLHLVAGSWGLGVIHSLVVFCLLSVFSRWAFGFQFLKPGLGALAAFYFGLVLTSAVIGVIVCTLAFRLGGRAHVGASSIVSVLTLLSGIYYPVEILPEPLRALSWCIPLTYFLEYFRSFFGFEARCATPLLLGYGLAVSYLVFALAGLLAAVRHSKKTGALLKMSE